MIKSFKFYIFPRKLWVAIGSDYEELRNRFRVYTDAGYDIMNATDYNNIVGSEESFASTTRVCNSRTKDAGYLVYIQKDCEKKLDIHEFTRIIAHEAVHVNDYLLDDIGARTVDTEINAYITDYVVGKILNTVTAYRNNKKQEK